VRAADLDLSSVPRRSAAAWTEVLDGEAVILDQAGNRLHHLNPTATVAWTCFDGTGTLADLAADLAHEFATDPSTTAADVVALARELGAAGLLEGVEPDPDPDDEPDDDPDDDPVARAAHRAARDHPPPTAAE
jgi:hypothetical protein